MGPNMSSFVVIIVIGVLFLVSAIKIIPEYERVVVFRLGRLSKALVGGHGPGLVIIIPGVDRVVRVDLRVITMDVPTQEAITRDNVPVKVNAVIYFRVMNPQNAIVEVENFIAATSQIAQTTLRSVLGQSELDELLSQREKINQRLQTIVDDHTDPWGIKVSTVEVKDVELPQGMQRAMAKQAEAERERRAKIIAAEGEFQASQKLADAAGVISEHPIALQLRFLQTLTEIATEHNSTTIFPVPIDLFTPFIKQLKGDKT
ncbi:MAG: SPFH domain-containing protein [bacterium]